MFHGADTNCSAGLPDLIPSARYDTCFICRHQVTESAIAAPGGRNTNSAELHCSIHSRSDVTAFSSSFIKIGALCSIVYNQTKLISSDQLSCLVVGLHFCLWRHLFNVSSLN